MIASSFSDPTVIVALVGGICGIVGITLSSLLSQRNQKSAATKIDEIHIMVNSQKDQMEKRIKALETKLGLASGEDIPAPAIVTAHSDQE